jgi:hypothetical protein
MYSHSDTIEEYMLLRFGKLKKIVDVVIYPDSENQIIVSLTESLLKSGTNN